MQWTFSALTALRAKADKRRDSRTIDGIAQLMIERHGADAAAAANMYAEQFGDSEEYEKALEWECVADTILKMQAPQTG